MTDPTETPIGEMWLDRDGVLWHRIRPGATITVEDAEAVIEIVRRLTGGRQVPAVIDIREVTEADSRVRERFAGSTETSLELATALVVSSGLSRMLGNLFLLMNRPERPVRLFTSEDKAAEWARSFLR